MTDSTFPDEWNQAKHVPFDDVRCRLEGATLPERKSILDFIRSNVDRIFPTVDDDWLYDSMSSYLLECIVLQTDSGSDDDSIHSSFEAAHELVEWFNWIVLRDDNPTPMKQRVDCIAAVFTNGDNSVRNCIETGFLEHLLETPNNRQYFSHWQDDVILAESYAEALRWGEAHSKPNAL